jgi:hypothetical protein
VKTIAVALVIALLIPALSGAQVVGEASATPDIVSHLKVTSPTADKVYSGSMHLVFTIVWDVNLFVFWLSAKIGYVIDNYSPVFFQTKEGANNGNNNYTTIDYNDGWITTEAIIVDVSSLWNGEYNLTIIVANGKYNVNNDFIRDYSCSFAPISFKVDNSLPPTSRNPAEIPNPSVEIQEIMVRSLANNESCIDSVPLVFTIYLSIYSGPYSPYTDQYHQFGKVDLWHNGYSYSLDGKANVSIAGNTTLTGLANGTHSIRVYESLNYYNSYLMITIGPQPYGTVYSSLINFTFSNTIPTISNLSVENKTYFAKSTALNFSVNEPIASAWYSLDSQSNVTIQGNTTLEDLADGSHSIIVYANDAVGNTGASQTAYFTVAKETEPKPETEPFPTVPVAVVASVTIVAAAAGLLLYQRKRRREAAQT